MGYQVYLLGGRYCGYGIPSICDHPKCDEEIDRGLDYCCGGDPVSEYGCGQYFCENHREFHEFEDTTSKEVCEQCANFREPFPIKPDTQEWIDHMLTDESWAEWRENNPKKVKEMSK